MKRLIKIFIKATQEGETFYQDTTNVNAEDRDNINVSVRKRIFLCPACGNPLDSRQVRTDCPICPQGICCDWCHEQRIRFHRIAFDQTLQVVREHRNWIESKSFDGFPFINMIRRIVGFNGIRRLEDTWRRP
jgi:hypothetical protein